MPPKLGSLLNPDSRQIYESRPTQRITVYELRILDSVWARNAPGKCMFSTQKRKTALVEHVFSMRSSDSRESSGIGSDWPPKQIYSWENIAKFNQKNTPKLFFLREFPRFPPKLPSVSSSKNTPFPEKSGTHMRPIRPWELWGAMWELNYLPKLFKIILLFQTMFMVWKPWLMVHFHGLKQYCWKV
jgi:hypothetical protein